jgi:hypothetical protein
MKRGVPGGWGLIRLNFTRGTPSRPLLCICVRWPLADSLAICATHGVWGETVLVVLVFARWQHRQADRYWIMKIGS